MRIKEIANAEEQVGLLKLIMDKTWDAIATQQRQQRQQAQAKATQQRAAKPAAKRKGLNKASAAIPKPPAPKAPTPNKTKHTLQPALANPQPKYLNPQPTQTLRQPNPQLKPTTPTPTLKAPIPSLPSPQNPSTDTKPAEYGEKYAAIKKYGEGDDRYSKNTFRQR